ncbi:MAG: 16S rRNA (cytidine(1402)-2'-O)-methyltransferase [Gemmatimonadota bacterium]|nr:16S rRNA (cytidine(1402)-2'-O)-methyltransferase [Gemmatimonadota bacterium]
MTPGALYLVGTPIGNRGDLAPRAREVLTAVGVVACEDTRTARHLFGWLERPLPELISYHEHNVDRAVSDALSRLEGGEDVAVVSDAGMPAIQDPGYRLVVAARGRGVDIVPVPGPTASVLALAASGLPTDRFAFLGWAPRKGRERWWGHELEREETLVVYESPRRLAATAAAIAERDPDRNLVLARELTKVHEEFVSGAAGRLAEDWAAREQPFRGECTLVVEGAPEAPGGERVRWRRALERLEESSAAERLTARDRVDVLSAVFPAERNAIYRAVHARGEGAGPSEI